MCRVQGIRFRVTGVEFRAYMRFVSGFFRVFIWLIEGCEGFT